MLNLTQIKTLAQRIDTDVAANPDNLSGELTERVWSNPYVAVREDQVLDNLTEVSYVVGPRTKVVVLLDRDGDVRYEYTEKWARS